MNLKRVLGGVALAALGSVLVYAVLLVVTDVQAAADAMRSFPASTFVAMLALSMGCFLIRAVRWRQLLVTVGFRESFLDALYQQLATQTMTVTPGRVGEVLKPWLAKHDTGIPMTNGLALVFAERVADLIGVCILSLGALSVIGGGAWALPVALLAVLAGAAIAGSEWFHTLALRVVAKQDWAKKHHASATALSETIRLALSWRALLWSVPASVIAWGLEGVGFALCLSALGFDKLSVLAAVSIYAISTIVGALTFLPGGIGLTEASMAGLLVAVGMNGADASAATLITRIATLWFGVAVGWIALASRPRMFRALLATGDAGTLGDDDAATGP